MSRTELSVATALTGRRQIRLRSKVVKGWRKFATAARKWTFHSFRLKARTLDYHLPQPGMASNGLMLWCVFPHSPNLRMGFVERKSLGSGRMSEEHLRSPLCGKADMSLAIKSGHFNLLRTLIL